jgi:hypothetical protein
MDPTEFFAMNLIAVFPSLLLVAVLAWMIFSRREPPSFWRPLDGEFDRLRNEVRDGLGRRARLPVFSAETTNGKEAEFIRERLPRKAPRALLALALLVFGVFVWWFTR